MKQHLQHKLERLDKEREEMYQSVEQLSEEDLHDESYGWSIIQVFSHLNDAEAGSILYMSKKMKAGTGMKDFSFGNKLRMTMSKAFLQSGLKWKAPSFISNPVGDYSFDEMKEKWEKTREQTKQYVKAYPKELIDKAVYRHPFAGRLDLANAIDSFTYHQRHHMHQLKRIKKKIRK